MKKIILVISFVLIFVSFVSASCSIVGDVDYANSKYCGVDGEWVSMVNSGENCINNYECLGGSCVSGICQSEFQGLNERTNLIGKIWCSVSTGFSGMDDPDYIACMIQCGDGVLDTSIEEECDDGNNNAPCTPPGECDSSCTYCNAYCKTSSVSTGACGSSSGGGSSSSSGGGGDYCDEDCTPEEAWECTKWTDCFVGWKDCISWKLKNDCCRWTKRINTPIKCVNVRPGEVIVEKPPILGKGWWWLFWFLLIILLLVGIGVIIYFVYKGWKKKEEGIELNLGSEKNNVQKKENVLFGEKKNSDFLKSVESPSTKTIPLGLDDMGSSNASQDSLLARGKSFLIRGDLKGAENVYSQLQKSYDSKQDPYGFQKRKIMNFYEDIISKQKSKK